MGWEKGGRGLGNTLGYWRGVWDVDRPVSGSNRERVSVNDHAKGGKGVNGNPDTKVDTKVEAAEAEADAEKIRALREWNRERFGTVRGVVEGYLRKCGWVWVQMDGLFGFALR